MGRRFFETQRINLPGAVSFIEAEFVKARVISTLTVAARDR